MHHLRHGWLPVLVAWLATRVVLLGWVMGGAGYFDVGLYLKWSSVLEQGSFPVGDAEWQYPPAFGPMLLAFGSDRATFMQRFTLGMFVLDAVVLVALLLASRGRRGSTRGPWAWVVLGLCLGPTLYTHADLAPTAFAVVGVLLAARPRLSGLFAGVGVLLKVWPGLALLAVPRRHLAQAATVSLATALGLWALIALLIDDSGSFLAQQAGRGLQIEAAAAWPYLAWNVLAGGDAWAAEAAYGSLMVATESAGLAANVATVDHAQAESAPSATSVFMSGLRWRTAATPARRNRRPGPNSTPVPSTNWTMRPSQVSAKGIAPWDMPRTRSGTVRAAATARSRTRTRRSRSSDPLRSSPIGPAVEAGGNTP